KLLVPGTRPVRRLLPPVVIASQPETVLIACAPVSDGRKSFPQSLVPLRLHLHAAGVLLCLCAETRVQTLRISVAGPPSTVFQTMVLRGRVLLARFARSGQCL